MRNFIYACILLPGLLIMSTTIYAQSDFSLEHKKHAWSNCLTGDVYLLVDMSGSISGYDGYVWETVDALSQGLLRDNGKARLSMLIFDTNYAEMIPLTGDYQEVAAAIQENRQYDYTGGGTDIATGFQGVMDLYAFNDQSPFADEVDFKKLVILISDGESEPKRSAYHAHILKRQGWWIYSVLLPAGTGNETLDKRSSDLMLELSGFYDNGQERKLFDSVYLDSLSQHIKELFTCL